MKAAAAVAPRPLFASRSSSCIALFLHLPPLFLFDRTLIARFVAKAATRSEGSEATNTPHRASSARCKPH